MTSHTTEGQETKRMAKGRCLVLAGGFSDKTFDAWQKDVHNFMDALKQRYELHGMVITARERSAVAAWAKAKELCIDDSSIYLEQDLRTGHSTWFPFPLPLRYFSKEVMKGVLRRCEAVTPETVLLSPFHLMGMYAARWPQRGLLCYVADSPSFQMLRLAREAHWFGERLGRGLSGKFYLLLEKRAIKKGATFIVVTEEMREYYVANEFPADKIKVCAPGFKVTLEGNRPRSESVLFIRPNSGGKRIVFEALAELTKDRLKPGRYVVVNGGYSKQEEEYLAGRGVVLKDFVEDLDAEMQAARAVVLADMDGIGFCNRAAQAMLNGALLVSTTNGARGTEAVPGVHYLAYSDARELKGILTQVQSRPHQYEGYRQASRTFGRRFSWESFRERFLAIVGS